MLSEPVEEMEVGLEPGEEEEDRKWVGQMEESREGLMASTDLSPWDIGSNWMSSQGKVDYIRSYGNDNQQAKCKNGHGSNKSEGNHNEEKQLNQQAMAMAEMVSHLGEKKQNDKQKQEEKQKIRNRWKYKQQTTQIDKKR